MQPPLGGSPSPHEAPHPIPDPSLRLIQPSHQHPVWIFAPGIYKCLSLTLQSHTRLQPPPLSSPFPTPVLSQAAFKSSPPTHPSAHSKMDLHPACFPLHYHTALTTTLQLSWHPRQALGLSHNGWTQLHSVLCLTSLKRSTWPSPTPSLRPSSQCPTPILLHLICHLLQRWASTILSLCPQGYIHHRASRPGQ